MSSCVAAYELLHFNSDILMISGFLTWKTFCSSRVYSVLGFCVPFPFHRIPQAFVRSLQLYSVLFGWNMVCGATVCTKIYFMSTRQRNGEAFFLRFSPSHISFPFHSLPRIVSYTTVIMWLHFTSAQTIVHNMTMGFGCLTSPFFFSSSSFSCSLPRIVNKQAPGTVFNVLFFVPFCGNFILAHARLEHSSSRNRRCRYLYGWAGACIHGSNWMKLSKWIQSVLNGFSNFIVATNLCELCDWSLDEW